MGSPGPRGRLPPGEHGRPAHDRRGGGSRAGAAGAGPRAHHPRPAVAAADRLPGHSPVAESYRALRSAIRFAGVEHPLRTLVVSSADKGEGKSVTAMNLAIAMALEGRRVVLVDTDLRHPTVHRLLEWEMKPGLSELLVDAVPLEQRCGSTRGCGLQVLPSGAMPPNPASSSTPPHGGADPAADSRRRP